MTTLDDYAPDFSKATAILMEGDAAVAYIVRVVNPYMEHNCTVKVYVATGWEDWDTKAKIDCAAQVGKVSLTWDGCCNFLMNAGETNHMVHTCSAAQYEATLRAMKWARDCAQKLIPAWLDSDATQTKETP
jgi:hypothetical protein